MGDLKTYTQEELDKHIDEAKTATIGELTAEREKNRAMKARLDEVEASLKKLTDEADEARKKAERAELEKKGKFDELLKKHTDEYNAALAKKDEFIADLKGKLTTFRVDNTILAAAENAIKPEDVVTLLKSRFKISETDDGAIKITTPDDTPVLDKDGKAVDLKGLTTTFLAENTQYVKPSTPGGGAGLQNGAAGAGEEGKAPATFNYETMK